MHHELHSTNTLKILFLALFFQRFAMHLGLFFLCPNYFMQKINKWHNHDAKQPNASRQDKQLIMYVSVSLKVCATSQNLILQKIWKRVHSSMGFTCGSLCLVEWSDQTSTVSGYMWSEELWHTDRCQTVKCWSTFLQPVTTAHLSGICPWFWTVINKETRPSTTTQRQMNLNTTLLCLNHGETSRYNLLWQWVSTPTHKKPN